jgi:hypothetical protein
MKHAKHRAASQNNRFTREHISVDPKPLEMVASHEPVPVYSINFSKKCSALTHRNAIARTPAFG